VFTGGPGTGKSRAARAVARAYHELGLLTYGQLIEIAAADLTGTTSRETGILIGKAIKPTGDLRPTILIQKPASLGTRR
jgi:stage V sporulation protein K